MKDHHRPIPPPAASSASSSARRHSGTALAAAGAGAPSSPGVGTEEPRLLPTSLPQPPQPQRQPQLQPQPQPPARQSQQLQLPQPFLFESWSIDRSDPSSSTQLPSSSSAIQHSPSPSSSSSSSSRNHPDLQSPSSATTNLLASLLSSAPSSAPSKTSAAVGQTSSFKYFVRRWSCATCRARKVKCDGARPRCSNCAKRDQSTVCYYDQDSMNNQALAGPSSTRRSVKGPVRERRVGTTDSMDTKMGGDAEALRLDPNNLADLLARTRLVENLFRPSIYSEADEGSPVLSVKLPVRPDALPNEEAMLVEGFFRSPQWGLQVVHRLSLLRNWESEPAILKAAICAVGASDPTMLLPKSVMMWYYDFSRSQFSEACDVPSLKILQALLILGIQSYVIGKVSAARNVLGTACRMALFLDLNVDPDDLSHPLSVIDGEIRRRCWWSCYTLEQFLASEIHLPRASVAIPGSIFC
ncbi:hypothetical protein DFJ73DRAFT_491274 [Zopfochytrium polystomum]|nr:hypothetical protein DFJ73DRAFT_491274 [Zopfochytrium polystomum]